MGTRKYQNRDHFFSGSVDWRNYSQPSPTVAVIDEQKEASRSVRRRVARMVRKARGGREPLSAYTPDSENEPYRKG